MVEQTGEEINWDRIPPEPEDFPEVVIKAMNVFNSMGGRIYPDIGYIGKDYTLLSELMLLYPINNKDFFLEVLEWLDARVIKQSADQLKREYDKMKRKH